MINWHGKKIAIVGFGKEGQAVAEYVLREGGDVTICDEREAKQLGLTYELWQARNVHWRLGPSYLSDLTGFSIIIRSPGVLPNQTPLVGAAKTGAIITTATKIFFEYCPCPIIGVTGTKGKGTTATLIAKMLEESRKKIRLVGNIGLPAIQILPELTAKDWVIFELSSFQLQDLEQSPHIAVMLGITPDHLNYHKDMDEYIDAKTNILAYQKNTDTTVLNIDYPTTAPLRQKMRGKILEISHKALVDEGAYVENGYVVRKLAGKVDRVCKLSEIRLKGNFNIENVLAAVAAASVAGANLAAIRRVLKSFAGLEHRLEFVSDIAGVEYWNNSYGTTPETTIAAIASFTEPIILLLGGSEKNVSYKDLATAILRAPIKVIISLGLSTKKMYAAIQHAAALSNKEIPSMIEGGETMEEIVRTAQKFAKAGDIVLLSPAAASFDKFTNATERGDQFKTEVKKLSAK